ncbi:MAG: GerMN domain-containing protein, partial [Spirochaetia bacterium]|nr:GerMN domain-containing protein [Spirochaetia bacterium]
IYFKKVKEDKDPESENWTVVKEDVSPDNSVKIQENNFSEIKSNEIKINSYFLYYYHDINGKLKLSGIPRKSNRSTDFKNIFKEIVSGPEFLHEHKKLIDSFPVKPTVINAYVNNKTLFLNLDDNFGRGISFETAQLQIEQILKTASQFKNINSVQFLINSEEIDSIHVDGLMIPSKLKTNKSLELSTAQEE